MAAFHGHRFTATTLSTWGMPAYPLAAPPSRVVRMEEMDEWLLAIHDFVSFSCTSGKKGTGAEQGCDPRPAPRKQSSSREDSGLGGLLTSSPILTATQATSRLTATRCGGGDNTRGGQPHRTFILRGREPIPRCCDRHPIHGWHTE